MLTTQDRDDDVFASLAAGADGYCLKDASVESLVAAIRAVSAGACWLDQGIAKRVLKASADRQSVKAPAEETKPDKFTLSSREHEVLELLVEGLSNQQMAARLFITHETVKTHMRHIMEKLVVSDRTQAAVKALREGLLSQQL
jgi:DNA-binding NarL/FixJ family response regulator